MKQAKFFCFFIYQKLVYFNKALFLIWVYRRSCNFRFASLSIFITFQSHLGAVRTTLAPDAYLYIMGSLHAILKGTLVALGSGSGGVWAPCPRFWKTCPCNFCNPSWVDGFISSPRRDRASRCVCPVLCWRTRTYWIMFCCAQSILGVTCPWDQLCKLLCSVWS